MGLLSQGLLAIGLFLAGIVRALTDLLLKKPVWANLEVLEDTDLRTTGGMLPLSLLFSQVLMF